MTTGQQQGEQILVARRRAGLTQSALAERIGVHVNTVVDTERGRVAHGLSEQEFQRWLAVLTPAPRTKSLAVSRQ